MSDDLKAPKNQKELEENPGLQNNIAELLDEEIADGDDLSLGHAPGGFDDLGSVDLDSARKNQGNQVDTARGPIELNSDQDQEVDRLKE